MEVKLLQSMTIARMLVCGSSTSTAAVLEVLPLSSGIGFYLKMTTIKRLSSQDNYTHVQNTLQKKISCHDYKREEPREKLTALVLNVNTL